MIPLSKDCPLAKQIFFLYLNLTKIIIQKKKKKRVIKDVLDCLKNLILWSLTSKRIVIYVRLFVWDVKDHSKTEWN